jgi:hypothetical protein
MPDDASCETVGRAGRQSPTEGNPPAVLSPQRTGSPMPNLNEGLFILTHILSVHSS